MTRHRRLLLIVPAVIAALIWLLPLSIALPLATPPKSGLSAARATGTIWRGALYDARLAGMPLGDTGVALAPFPLFVGEARLHFAAPALRGALTATAGSFGVLRANGTLDIAVRVKPLPVTQLVLDEASVRFAGARCIAAEGNVRAIVGGDIGGIALPGGMSGALRCDGDVLLVPLVGQSGLERLDLRIAGDGKWRGELAIRTSDPATVGRLSAAGFTPGPRGFQLRLTGQL